MTVLKVGVYRHTEPGERRVALVPEAVQRLAKVGVEVLVAAGAGAAAMQQDEAYRTAGATVVEPSELVGQVDVLLTVGRPDPATTAALRPGQALLGLLSPFGDPAFAEDLAKREITLISLEGLPRTLSRAQGMDALTSQANVAGYKAVLVAAEAYGRYLPMLVTAAGTARPAKVLVLGVGVAGLQAIGSARRLGAVVSAYDIRPEAKAEATSVGATFLDLGGPSGAGTGGYARALTEEEQQAQQAALTAHIARHDIVITTAQVPGRRPPTLVTAAAVAAMAPGAVIVDIAAGPLGGNVEGSLDGQRLVTDGGVTLIGAGNLPATVPVSASEAYSRNLTALLLHLVSDGRLTIDPTDEVQAGVVVTHEGKVIHPLLGGAA